MRPLLLIDGFRFASRQLSSSSSGAGGLFPHRDAARGNLFSSEDGHNALILHLEALDWPYGDICWVFSSIQATCHNFSLVREAGYSPPVVLLVGNLQIPAFAGYKIFGLLRGTFFSGGSEGEVEDEKSRKKREKMEKKASRGKMVKTRTR
ncbi:hypothetical protein PR202_gb09302 [Eleusine coracana subsp. coracana]|uniref:Uncharacterized protein n=1 Tax=Eleusine coracana subsp. coracana TaxID=191504 RepID=A0AAV5EGU6_ELECO|nr:hypothetical protein PR202_gb09302 [Eleusine coracana subsp. coracana]